MSLCKGVFVSQTTGDRIKLLRATRGVAEFAETLGVNRKTVTRWEANEALPDGASLLILREKFGADPGWLLTGIGETPSSTTLTADELQLLELFRAAPLAGKMAAVGALQGVQGISAMQKPVKQVIKGGVSGALTQTGNITYTNASDSKSGKGKS
ncbi:MAG: hypothetical protein H6R04_715 [Burkholderiaceae bacterium]|nr:hypothetical protein [Burkholderiaceae bacterium]